MELLTIAALAVFVVFVIFIIGLASVSQTIGYNDYNQWSVTTTTDYYNNPLCRTNSKWFHYRPKGSVIILRKQWLNIEKNIGIEIAKARETGRALGRQAAIVEIQDKITKEKAKTSPSSPYELLGVKATTPLAEIKKRCEYLLQIYNPNVFVSLDKAFIELAEIRTEQFKKAWKQINTNMSKGKKI